MWLQYEYNYTVPFVLAVIRLHGITLIVYAQMVRIYSILVNKHAENTCYTTLRQAHVV